MNVLIDMIKTLFYCVGAVVCIVWAAANITAAAIWLLAHTRELARHGRGQDPHGGAESPPAGRSPRDSDDAAWVSHMGLGVKTPPTAGARRTPVFTSRSRPDDEGDAT